MRNISIKAAEEYEDKIMAQRSAANVRERARRKKAGDPYWYLENVSDASARRSADIWNGKVD